MLSRLVPFFPVVFVLLWSTGFIGARYSMPHAEPFTFLSLRYALALAILLPIVWLFRAAWPGRRAAFHAMVAGSLIHGAYLGGVFVAVRHGLPAGIASLIVGLQPVATAVLAASFLSERVTPRHWIGLGLGLLGVCLVVVPKLDGDPAFSWITLAPAFLAMAGISVGTIWQKRFVGGVDLKTGTVLQYVGALVPSLALALLFEERRIEWTGEFLFALVWLTLVLSIGAIFLLLFMIREGAVSKVASLMYLTPGVTAVMAYLLFGETLTLLQLAGLALAGIGVAAAMRTPARRKAPAGI